MKFSVYLIQKRGLFYKDLSFLILFLVSFALYRLPLQAVVYPCILCATADILLLLFGYAKEKRKCCSLQSFRAECPGDLPRADTGAEKEYQALIENLCTTLKENNQRADAEYRNMVDYYSTWAHQIKTPIASMTLKLQNEDSPLARSLNADLGRIGQYVEMVLTFLRLNSDSTDFVLRSCDLDTIVRQSVRRFSGEFIDRKLALHYSPLNTTVLTDEKWLGFVIDQVLSNALKYTPSGSISIFLASPCTLCIRDTGMGIAPEDLPRIFENGFTGFHGRADRKASGIGLYLCRRICKNLGHTISAQAQPGIGTTISIDLETKHLEVE